MRPFALKFVFMANVIRGSDSQLDDVCAHAGQRVRILRDLNERFDPVQRSPHAHFEAGRVVHSEEGPRVDQSVQVLARVRTVLVPPGRPVEGHADGDDRGDAEPCSTHL